MNVGTEAKTFALAQALGAVVPADIAWPLVKQLARVLATSPTERLIELALSEYRAKCACGMNATLWQSGTYSVRCLHCGNSTAEYPDKISATSSWNALAAAGFAGDSTQIEAPPEGPQSGGEAGTPKRTHP